MATDILVPTLGESVSEATVAQWLKQVGDPVAVDEPVVELETDKVTLEVGASEAGVLAEVVVAEGANVEVGALLGRVEAAVAGTAPARAAKAPEAAPPEAPAPAAAAPAPAVAIASAANGEGAPVDLVVPVLGESVTEAAVAQWLKQPGDAVAADEPVVELETDKVNLEVGAPAAGTLAEIRAEAGATVEVGAVLGVVLAGAAAAAAPAQPAGAPAPAATAPAAQGAAHGQLSPAVRKLVADHGLDPALIPGSGKEGRLTKADIQQYLESGAAAVPAAAASLDPVAVARSGAGGKISKSDLLTFLGGPAAVPAARAPAPAAPASGAAPREERVRMTKLRQTIARRLKEAQNTAAVLTTFNEADMGAVMALRAQHKEAFEKKHGVKLGFMSFFTKAAVKALKELPSVNAQIDGEEIVYKHHYDVGMAVSTPAGLMVPVVRDCDAKSFAEIEQSIVELATKGRDGKLSMEEMTGGTFTITNGGIFGSLLSTPILNIPQSAILGLHKIQQRPMVVDGKVEARPMMYLALSYDHRIIDGREAVTFLVKLKEAIEDPERLLLDL